ncbi:MAG: 1-acyl-sn-glycerol-3-phosphate acyltransferase [bacterium]|nr:1-acyl-sn-glycerol-3-phosphate acyltransferase [bacterium]
MAGSLTARTSRRFGYWFIQLIARCGLKALFGMKVVGLENVPRTGGLWLVSNHQSNFDPPIVGSTVPREIYFAAKKSLFKGLLGKIIVYCNSIPVNRTGFDLDIVRKTTTLVKNGNAVIIFPEGTRSLDGTFLPIKGGVGMLLQMAPAMVLPIRIEGSWRLDKKMYRKEKLCLYVGKPIPPEQFLNVEGEGTERHVAIANAVFNEIRKLGNGNPERAANE